MKVALTLWKLYQYLFMSLRPRLRPHLEGHLENLSREYNAKASGKGLRGEWLKDRAGQLAESEAQWLFFIVLP